MFRLDNPNGQDGLFIERGGAVQKKKNFHLEDRLELLLIVKRLFGYPTSGAQVEKNDHGYVLRLRSGDTLMLTLTAEIHDVSHAGGH